MPRRLPSATRCLLVSFALVFLALASGCDSSEAPPKEDVSTAVRHLDPGQFSSNVEGRPAVEADLSGRVRYGFIEEEEGRSFAPLFIADTDPQQTVLFTASQGQREPGQYRIGNAFDSSGENAFKAFYRAGERLHLSLSGQLTLYEVREEDGEDERGGQFNMATEEENAGPAPLAAQIVGSFRALPADDFDALLQDYPVE